MTSAAKGRGFGITAVAVLWIAGCGGGAAEHSPGASSASETSAGGESTAVPSAPVRKTGSGSVAARLGQAGGTLELTNGPRVEVPPGAIAQAMDFVLKEAPMTTAFHNSEHERPVGPTFIFSPAVEAPSGQKVTVSIPLASYPEGWGDVAIAYEYPVGDMVGAEDAEHTKWQYENADLRNGRAVADLPALNGYRLQFVLSNLESQ